MESLGWGWGEFGQLALALLLGFVIGIQRERRHKPAGITTISIVTITSTLVMQLSYRLPTFSDRPGGRSRFLFAGHRHRWPGLALHGRRSHGSAAW